MTYVLELYSLQYSLIHNNAKNKDIRLIDLIYDNSILAVEFGPENGISDDKFKVSIENAFSKFFE